MNSAMSPPPHSPPLPPTPQTTVGKSLTNAALSWLSPVRTNANYHFHAIPSTQFSCAFLRLVQARLTLSWITRAHEICVTSPKPCISNHWSNVRKGPSGIFSSGKQKLLVEVYEEHKHIITQKGNTVTINKYREAIWQKNAHLLNAWVLLSLTYFNLILTMDL